MQLIIVVFICFLLQAVVVSQEWIHQPENVAVLVGNDLTLRCLPKSVNVSVNWVFYTNGTENIPLALTDDNGCLEKSPWKYKCSEGNRILNFNCTDRAYAGTYECRISGKKTNMELTILESNPICNTKNIAVVENNYIEMWCIVNYSGDWAPVMEWGQDVTDNTVLQEFNGNVTNRTSNNRVISTLRLLAESERHNSQYYSKTYFTNDSILYSKRRLAQNVPTYNHTWISPNISVLYGPRNMKITQQLEIFPSGIVNCSVEANPSANYTWTDISSGSNNYGPMLILNEHFIPGQTYTFECAASNYIGSPLTKNLTLTVPYKPTDNTVWKVAIISVAGILVGAIIVIMVAAVVAKNNKDQQIASTAFNMEAIDNEPDGNIESGQNTRFDGYETVLGSEEDELYSNLTKRSMSKNVEPEERVDATSSSCNEEGPYEVLKAVLRTNMVQNQGDPYQELRVDDNTVTRYTQDGPYEVFYLNSPSSAANTVARDRRSRPSASDNAQYINLSFPSKG